MNTLALSKDARESSKIPVPAIDLGERMGHAEAQELSPLAAGASHPAAAVSPRVVLAGPLSVVLLDPIDELDLSEVLIPAQAKDRRREKGFDPRI